MKFKVTTIILTLFGFLLCGNLWAGMHDAGRTCYDGKIVSATSRRNF